MESTCSHTRTAAKSFFLRGAHQGSDPRRRLFQLPLKKFHVHANFVDIKVNGINMSSYSICQIVVSTYLPGIFQSLA